MQDSIIQKTSTTLPISEEKRLQYLLQYHHSLSIQIGSVSLGEQIRKVEREIERLLNLG